MRYNLWSRLNNRVNRFKNSNRKLILYIKNYCKIKKLVKNIQNLIKRSKNFSIKRKLHSKIRKLDISKK